jgi:hypothetical protein
MLMKSICKNMQNYKIYTSYTYFHTFQPQNKNGLVNQESGKCPGFENKICRCSKKNEVKECIVASTNVVTQNGNAGDVANHAITT